MVLSLTIVITPGRIYSKKQYEPTKGKVSKGKVSNKVLLVQTPIQVLYSRTNQTSLSFQLQLHSVVGEATQTSGFVKG